MWFEIIGSISQVETIATGRSIKDFDRIQRVYGPGRWRKCKGIATVRIPDATIYLAEVHWYEAHGIGRKEMKLKHLIEKKS